MVTYPPPAYYNPYFHARRRRRWQMWLKRDDGVLFSTSRSGEAADGALSAAVLLYARRRRRWQMWLKRDDSVLFGEAADGALSAAVLLPMLRQIHNIYTSRRLFLIHSAAHLIHIINKLFRQQLTRSSHAHNLSVLNCY